MTRAQISKIISAKMDNDFKIIHVKCRPPEKSDQVLTVKVGEHTWYAERPKYFWSTFDRSFVEKPYLAEEKLLYPDTKEPLSVFDSKGRLWNREEMSSFGLVEYFTKNPTLYLWMMSRHTTQVQGMVEEIKKISPTLNKPSHFKANLLAFVGFYYKMYEAQGTIYTTFDELVWQFRELLLKYLPKETVNTYFPQFLSGEATKEVLKKGYTKDRGALEYSTTRGVLYGMDLTPRTFYIPPHYFPDFPEDNKIVSMLFENKATKADIEKFFAFRTIVPFGFQINEESQYIETSLLSAHLGVLTKSISKYLKISTNDLQKSSINQIIKKINYA